MANQVNSQAIRRTRDLLPPERRFGIMSKTPHAPYSARSASGEVPRDPADGIIRASQVGSETDIVSKEMYTLGL